MSIDVEAKIMRNTSLEKALEYFVSRRDEVITHGKNRTQQLLKRKLVARWVESGCIRSIYDLEKDIHDEITRLRIGHYSASHPIRHDEWVESTVWLIPLGRHAIVMLSSNVEALFEDIEDYSYWDFTDRPDDVSANAWHSRRKAWESIFSRYGNYPQGSSLRLPLYELGRYVDSPSSGKLLELLRNRECVLKEYALYLVASRLISTGDTDELSVMTACRTHGTAEESAVQNKYSELKSSLDSYIKVIDSSLAINN